MLQFANTDDTAPAGDDAHGTAPDTVRTDGPTVPTVETRAATQPNRRLGWLVAIGLALLVAGLALLLLKAGLQVEALP